jgi:hypothetical protein
MNTLNKNINVTYGFPGALKSSRINDGLPNRIAKANASGHF